MRMTSRLRRTVTDGGPAGPDGAGGRLPNLLVVGVSRGGTTSLFHYLGQHRDIGLADVKELRYFTPLRYGEPLAPVDTYTAHFAGCTDTRYAVEATPGYFYGGRVLARGIRSVCPPDTRVVVSLRSPAERCWSWYQFVKSRLRIPKDMTYDAYLDRCEELHAAGLDDRLENQAFWGLGGGCYAQWLDDWVEEFGARFKVVFFEDLVGDPRRVVSELTGWLGVDARPVDDFDFAVDNKSEQYRHGGMQALAIRVNRRAEPFFHKHLRVKRALRHGYYLVNRQDSEPERTAATGIRLDDFYRPHNKRLAEQLSDLGVALPGSWATDAPDTGISTD
jgi:hypothetical protein